MLCAASLVHALKATQQADKQSHELLPQAPAHSAAASYKVGDAPEGAIGGVTLARDLLKAAPVLCDELCQLLHHFARVGVFWCRGRADGGWNARASWDHVSPGEGRRNFQLLAFCGAGSCHACFATRQ